MPTRTWILLITLLAGCASGDDTVSGDLTGQDIAPDAADFDISITSDLHEAPETDAAADWWKPAPDSDDDAGGPECLPGEGCFLDSCDENGDCDSGYCVEHMGEGICSQLCQDECPEGWTCQQVAGTEPDVVFICVSLVANLCRPCATGTDCKSVGGAEDVCVDYGPEGSFCGAACGAGDSCPAGFTCLETQTVDRVPVKQCVANAGVCPCTDKSVALGLWTPCELGTEWGTCPGKRVCEEEGLSSCDAPEPTEEICDGEDNDCDGETDEVTCDDDNECTEDLCNGADGCEHVALNGGECKDDNPCTVADTCEAGVCVGNPVTCDDGNPCTDDSCVETGGCSFEANQAACDDGDPCTVADTCEAGACVGYPLDCDCQEDTDCLVLEDDDLCNGTLHCDTGSLPFRCQVDPDTIVDCAPLAGDAQCVVQACDPATGECSEDAAAPGLPCDDGDACTLGDGCLEGTCQGGAPANCNDGNPCTDDSCDQDVGCVHATNTAPCSDGDVCTTGDACAQGACVPSGALDCQDGNPCTSDACDPQVGCAHAPVDGPCDDGNACTPTDLCQGGACVGSGILDCQDETPCTTSWCDPATGCVQQLNDAPCDDGDVCTVGDHCHLGTCISSEALNCDDDNICTDDTCSPQAGCVFTPNATPCDDGDPCTEDDACAGGWCKGGPGAPCDDGNPCTDDTCVPGVGCQAVPNTAPCDDGDACTTGEHCADGACLAGTPTDCDDGLFCTGQESCAAQTGCLPGTPPETDDGDPCTIDLCDEAGDEVVHVSVLPPGSPDAPTGPAEVEADQIAVAYSVPPVDGATSYTWSVPGDATIHNGQGTTSITVDFGAAPGQICVFAAHGCGQSAPACLSVSIQAQVKRIFVTSTKYGGNLGGLDGADAKCQTRADAAGLGGTWKAWLSSGSVAAKDRLSHSSKPYVRTDGAQVAASWDALVGHWPDVAPENDEFGNTVPLEGGGSMQGCSWAGGNFFFPWTNTTNAGGIGGSTHCSNWTTTGGTGKVGLGGYSLSQWTDWCSGFACSYQARLYCFEQ